MGIPMLANNRFIPPIPKLKAVILGLFALVLLAGSACVNVIVHVRTSGGGLTGTHCKLQRPLTNQHQESNVWCWAASAHTVIEYLKNQPIRQCDLLQAVYRGRLSYEWEQLPKATTATLESPNCCLKMPEDDVDPKETNIEIAQNICYQNGWPEAVFATEEFHTTFAGVEYDWSIPYPHGLGWREIVEEICADRPMIDRDPLCSRARRWRARGRDRGIQRTRGRLAMGSCVRPRLQHRGRRLLSMALRCVSRKSGSIYPCSRL